jgi:4-hydroxybenzoate polyprenyltransferase
LSLFHLPCPAHCIKNGFVLVGLLFGRAIYKPNFVVAAIFFAFTAFRPLESFVHIVNELSDSEVDRLHPAKRTLSNYTDGRFNVFNNYFNKKGGLSWI